MRFLFFRLAVFFLTALLAVFPSMRDATVPCKQLPIRFSTECRREIFSPTGETVCEYPTVIRLEHQKNAADNGTLLATFELWGGTYPVFRSTDDGQTWQKLGHVTDDYNGYYNEWMPFLYELPADMGEFEAGTVLLAATSIAGEGVTDSTVTLYKSADLGKTFHAFCNVDKAGGTGEGVWEPYLIYEEESGRLFCFYSDDSDPAHDQKLVYKYTADLVHWSEKSECVACDDPALRPGMASVAKMGNGEYFMVYEMGGVGSYTVFCKRAAALDDWGDVSDCGTVISAAGKTLGSSPCVAWSPAGGPCGVLIVTANHMAEGGSATGSDWFLSFDFGKTFAPVENPLPYTQAGHERSGYSPSLFVTADGTELYYANNPPGRESAYCIAMAKIRLAAKGPVC